MKFEPQRRKSGVCYVCGKSTKLLIHAQCGKKCDRAKLDKKIGLGQINQQQHENSQHNSAKRKWAAGNLPKWATD